MAQEVKRAYNMVNEQVLAEADTGHYNATQDLAPLSAAVPSITAAWLDAMLQDINNARNYPTDLAVKLDISDCTHSVNASVKQGRKALSMLGNRAKLAFPEDVEKQRAFGNSTWQVAKDHQEKMQTALLIAQKTCNDAEYKNALMAEGMTQAEMDRLGEIAQEISDLNIKQEAAKEGRKVSTAERIVLYNLVWEHRAKLAAAAQVAWPDDAAKHEQYQLYPAAKGKAVVPVQDKLS